MEYMLAKEELELIRANFEAHSSVCIHYNPEFLDDLVDYIEDLQRMVGWLAGHCNKSLPIRADDPFWEHESEEDGFKRYWIRKAYDAVCCGKEEEDVSRDEYSVAGGTDGQVGSS